MHSIFSTLLVNPIVLVILLFICYYINTHVTGTKLIHSIVHQNGSKGNQFMRRQNLIRMKTIQSSFEDDY